MRAPGRAVGFVLSLLDPVNGKIEALKSEFTLDSGELFPGWQLFVRMARTGYFPAPESLPLTGAADEALPAIKLPPIEIPPVIADAGEGVSQ